MIEKIEPELIDDSCFISNKNILIPNQDKGNIDINSQKISNNIVKKEKDYIKKKIISFLRNMKAYTLIIFFSKID